MSEPPIVPREGVLSGSQRILVVDDQAEIRDLTASLLSSEGFEVSTASDGGAALDHIFRDAYDLVLLDINMPEMDGWETLRLLRADEGLHDLPVVMFSVKGEIRDKVHAIQMGATDYITKPFALDDLVGRVRQVLAGERDRAPADPPGGTS